MLESSFIVSSAYHERPTCYHLHKSYSHLMFENRLRTTCSRFSQSFTLPDEAVQFQLSGGNRWKEPAVRWFGFAPGFLLTLRFSNTHTQKHTHTIHIQTQHIHKDTNAHSQVNAYEYVIMLETVTRSKKNMKPSWKVAQL